MFFLVHLPHQTRPFLTSVDFIAQDFREWGFRVDSHSSNSKYIAEIRAREKVINRTEWKVELVELWAREVVSRKRQERERGYQIQTIRPEAGQLSVEARRFERVSKLVQDFVDVVATFDHPGTTHAPFPTDPRPVPQGPLGLISKYMRLLHAIRYVSNATLPNWANPDVLIADQVTLEFRFHEVLKKEHLVHAVNKAVSKNMGQMGRVERDKATGITKVLLFVEVSDIVLQQNGADEETRDPVPLYERGERPPPYV